MKVTEKIESLIGEFECPVCKKMFQIFHIELKTKTKHEVRRARWLDKTEQKNF